MKTRFYAAWMGLFGAIVMMAWLAGGGAGLAQNVSQPNIMFVSSKEQVRRYCITNLFQGGAVKQVASPAVPLKTGSNPDLYAIVMNQQPDGSVSQALLLTCDRKSRFSDYDQLIIKDGKTLPIKHVSENELGGRKTRVYMIPISDASYVKWAEYGVTMLFKGKSGELTLNIPEFVFAGLEEQFTAMVGGQSAKAAKMEVASNPQSAPEPKAMAKEAPAVVSATQTAAATPANEQAKPEQKTAAPAKQTATSPFLRSGSIGRQATAKKTDEQPGDELQLPKLTGEGLIGQEFLFLPLSPELHAKGYVLPVVGKGGADTLKLSYEQHVGRTLQVKSYASYEKYHATKYGEGKLSKSDAFMFRGGSVYETVIKETGQSVDIVVDILGAKPPWKYMALKRDLEFAQAKLVGKKYWLNTTTLYGYDAEKDKLQKYAAPKWGVVEVTEVVLGTDINPVRLIFKYAGDQEYFLDVEVSPKNDTGVGEDFFGFAAVSVPLKKMLLTTDPREKYKWPTDVMALVTRNQIKVGLTEEQVKIAWGEPNSVSHTLVEDIKVTYWHYEGSKLVAFEGGKVRTIIDN